MQKVAIILAGCGNRDGSEIHETVLSLLAIRQQGLSYQCFALNKQQQRVVNHLTGEELVAESRNMLVESARIARGQVADLESFVADDFDALLLPGGYGVALNLATYGLKGVDYAVDEAVVRAVQSMHAAGKPICALCIAPVILAKIIPQVLLTIGNDATVIADMERVGAHHQRCELDNVVIDRLNKVVTTPCYMYEASIDQIYEAVSRAIQATRSFL